MDLITLYSSMKISNIINKRIQLHTVIALKFQIPKSSQSCMPTKSQNSLQLLPWFLKFHKSLQHGKKNAWSQGFQKEPCTQLEYYLGGRMSIRENWEEAFQKNVKSFANYLGRRFHCLPPPPWRVTVLVQKWFSCGSLHYEKGNRSYKLVSSSTGRPQLM